MKLLHQYMQMSCSWFSVTLLGVCYWHSRLFVVASVIEVKGQKPQVFALTWRDPRLYSRVRHEGKGVKNCMLNWWVDAVGCDAACRWDHTFFQKHRWCNFRDSWSLVARNRKGMSRDLMLCYESARSFTNGVQVSPKRAIWGFFCAIHIVCVCALDGFNQHFCISESNE
jgi:hypothetical protein